MGATPECEEEEEAAASEEGSWTEGRGTAVVLLWKLGEGGGSGISKAYSQPPSWALIFVESEGKLCREGSTSFSTCEGKLRQNSLLFGDNYSGTEQGTLWG